jgi:pimeloyl-ACP methyl ester carboxylesterase
VRVTRALTSAIPTATSRSIPGAGHAAPFDAPKRFAALVHEMVDVGAGR